LERIGSAPPVAAAGQVEARTVIRYTPEDAKLMLENASSVIIIPELRHGRGAGAAHRLRDDEPPPQQRRDRSLCHPSVAAARAIMNCARRGRRAYEQYVRDGPHQRRLPEHDVVVVIGANDVTNPAARHKKQPLYGCRFSTPTRRAISSSSSAAWARAYAARTYDLFYDPKTMMVLGDAKAGRLPHCAASEEVAGSYEIAAKARES